MISKFIEVMDKLSNITSLKNEYKFHWSRAPLTLFFCISVVYLYPKQDINTLADYMPTLYTFIIAIISSASLAKRR